MVVWWAQCKGRASTCSHVMMYDDYYTVLYYFTMICYYRNYRLFPFSFRDTTEVDS